MKILYVTLALALGLLSQVQSSQAQTSKDNARLQKALERYPEADTNKDGVLTLEEAKAFVRKNAGKRRQRGAASAKAPEGGERHIYKKVGEVELPLYVFKPDGHTAEAKKPAIVFFFGGGWKSGNPSQFEHQCKHFASRGMVAITVEYRVSSRHPVKVEDASKKQPPCVIFFGTADGLLKGAELYQKKSEEAGNSCKLVTYEDQGHGFFNYGRSSWQGRANSSNV